MSNTAVGNIFTQVPKNPKSHVRGWAQHWADLIQDTRVLSQEDDMGSLDYLYFDHGVNTEPGKLNLFGGVTEDMVDRILDVVLGDVKVLSLDHEMHSKLYCDGLRSRIGQKTCSKYLTHGLINVLEDQMSKLDHRHLSQIQFVHKTNSVAMGDSHTTSYARKGQPVIKRDGMTLHGALKNSEFETLVANVVEVDPDLRLVTLVAGSVDIRHHIGRRPDPKSAVQDLALKFVDTARLVEDIFGVDVELSCPVPVEHAARRIPKTGHFEGEPFCGSVEDRRTWTEEFDIVVHSEWDGAIVKPPTTWYMIEPELYAKQHMELSSSVHIAPTSYRRLGGWEELNKED